MSSSSSFFFFFNRIRKHGVFLRCASYFYLFLGVGVINSYMIMKIG